jgi:hypothetical protein
LEFSSFAESVLLFSQQVEAAVKQVIVLVFGAAKVEEKPKIGLAIRVASNGLPMTCKCAAKRDGAGNEKLCRFIRQLIISQFPFCIRNVIQHEQVDSGGSAALQLGGGGEERQESAERQQVHGAHPGQDGGPGAASSRGRRPRRLPLPAGAASIFSQGGAAYVSIACCHTISMTNRF